MAQEFQQPLEQPGSSPLRAQRMTADESRAVIDLWQSERVEQTGLTNRPAVPDVAEGLDITVEDVQRLLLEVRARQKQEERALMLERTKLRLAEEENKLAGLRWQRMELQQEQAYTPTEYPRHSRWVEVKPGVWEEAEPAISEAGHFEVVKAWLKVTILGLLLVALPFSLLVYEIVSGLELR